MVYDESRKIYIEISKSVLRSHEQSIMQRIPSHIIAHDLMLHTVLMRISYFTDSEFKVFDCSGV